MDTSFPRSGEFHSIRVGIGVSNLPLRCAGTLLFMLGLLKLYAVFVARDVSTTPDPVIPLSMRHLALAMGIIEIQLGALILLLRSPVRAAQCLTAVGLGFIGYRWLHALKAGPSCPCLAGATNLLPMLRAYEDKVLLALAVWFFLVGLWTWTSRLK